MFDQAPSMTPPLDIAGELSLRVINMEGLEHCQSLRSIHTILQEVVGCGSGELLLYGFWVDWDLSTLYAADDWLIPLHSW